MKLRTYLILLVVTAVVPAWLFAFILMLRALQAERDAQHQRLVYAARGLSAAVDRELTAAIRLMEGLATSEHLDAGNFRRFYEQGSRILKANPEWETILLVNTAGRQVMNLRLPFGSRLPVYPPTDVVKEVLGTAKPVISDVFVSPIAKTPVIGVAVPVIRDGRTRYVLRFSTSPQLMLALLLRQNLAPETLAVIVDRSKKIVARTRMHAELLAKPVNPLLADLSSKSVDGLYQGSPQGEALFYNAFNRSELSGWTVAVGLPAAILDAPVRRTGTGMAVGGVLLLLVGIGLAIVVSRRVTVSVDALAGGAKAMGKGETPPLCVVPVAELSDVAREIEMAAANRKEAEDRVRQSERRYQDLYDNAPDMFLSVDAKTGRVVTCNQTAASEMGYAIEEIIGRPVLELYHPDCRAEVEQSFQTFVATGELRDVELHVMRKDAGKIDVSLNVSAVRDSEGRIVESRSVWRDITRRKRSEDELRKLTAELEQRVVDRTAELRERVAEAEQLNRGVVNLLEDLKAAQHRAEQAAQQLKGLNKELESFSYSVSHDLKAPLRSISGFAEILLRRHQANLNEEGRHYLDNIVEASGHMSRLIEDLLAFSRLGREALRREPVALSELVSKVWQELQADANKTGARLNVADGLPVIQGDPTMLRQLFVNLIGNAIAYRRPGVAPEVAVSCAAEDNGWATVRVSDNGVGIPKEHFEKIFNLFQRLHGADEYPGTGIGLAIVKKVAELHRGAVTVESTVGEGSTFSVTLASA